MSVDVEGEACRVSERENSQADPCAGDILRRAPSVVAIVLCAVACWARARPVIAPVYPQPTRYLSGIVLFRD